MHVSRPHAADGQPIEAVRAAAFVAMFGALQSGQPAVAEVQAMSWLARDSGDVEATLVLGLAVAAQGDADRAAPLLLRVAAARPDYAHPCMDVARMHPDAPSLAAAQFRACRALAPDDPKLGYAYADFLLNTGSPAPAAAVLRALLAHAPDFGPARNLYGMSLLELGDMQAAIAEFRQAAGLDPEEGAVWANLGMALKIEGRFDEAVAAHDKAIVRAPHDPRLRLNRAVTLLRAGRMAEAWPDYESRLAAPRGFALPLDRLLPRVDSLDLAGRTILAWHEEGFGDTLQFGRYLPLLAAHGARVLARLPPELHRLFAAMPEIATLDNAAPLPAYDWHVPVFSLPRAFATTLATIPAAIPYLHPDPALVAAWAARLDAAIPAGKLRVGLVWAGQARPWLPWFTTLDARRSTDAATLAPLAAVPGVACVSLQKGASPPRWAVDPMPDVTDFADTAAIVAGMDVVVSVDTSMVHLAGALGKPVLLVDRYDSCWRWLSGREDSPWYPSLTILRQPTPGDWRPVVARAAAILAGMVRT